MPRRPDTAALQAAKGNPNRRKSATTKREERALALAALLVQSIGIDQANDPPVLIAHDPVAVAMWRELAPVLVKTHRLQPQHRPIFTTFCTYYAQYILANDELRGKGWTQNVRTVAGGIMNRINPMVRIRDDAHKKCLELSKLFGLTPADEYSLFKGQAAAGESGNRWLFGEDNEPAAPATETSEKPSVVGSMASLDSVPPGMMVN